MKKTFTLLLSACMAFGALGADDVASSRVRLQKGLTMRDLQNKEYARIPRGHLTEGIARPENQLGMESDQLLPPATIRTKTPGGTTLYGYNTYSSRPYYSNLPGLFDASNPETPYMAKWLCWLSYMISNQGDVFKQTSGWYYNGDVYLFGQRCVFGWFDQGNLMARCAMKDGEPLTIQEFEDTYPPEKASLSYCTLNQEDMYIYGFGYNDAQEPIFGKAPFYDISAISEIVPMDSYDVPVGITYNCDDKQIYGITTDGRFVRYDKNGNLETIINERTLTEAAPQFVATLQGLCYSPTEQAFFWNAIEETGRSGLVRIDCKDWSVTRLWDYTYNDRFTFLFTTDQPVEGAAPAAPVIDDIVFVDAANDGYVEFTLPTKRFDGTAIPGGRIKWNLTVDNQLYNIGENAPGRKVRASVVSLAMNQVHEFEVSAEINGIQGPVSFRRKYIGYDKPAAPQNVTLDENGVITWDAVTTGANGGYFDPEGVYYKVYLNNKPVGQTAGLTFATPLPYPNDLTVIDANVIAVKGKLESPIGYSNKIIRGNPYTVDFNFYPTAAEFEFCELTSLEGYPIEGVSLQGIGNAFYLEGNDMGRTDAWLVLPPVEFSQTKTYYELMFSTLATASGEFTVTPCIGTSYSYKDMKPLTESVEPDETYTAHQFYFKPEAKGVYHLAFHFEGIEAESAMALNDIKILNTKVTDNSPAEVSGLQLKGAENGALVADVTFRMPTRTATGELIPEDTEITCDVRSETYTTVTGRPGETVKCKVGTTQSKYYRSSDRWSLSKVTVTPSIGKNIGLPTWEEVFTGIDVPERVNDLAFTVDEDNMGMHLTWTPPTAGVQGGYCPEDEIDYWIYRVVEDDLIGGADYQYEGHTKELEFSVRLPEGSPQEAVYYTVLARSAAGEIDGLYCIDLLGEPKKLPYEVNLLKAKDDNAGLLLSELAIYDGMDWNVSSWESACDVLKSVWPDLANVTDKGGYAFFCLGEADDLAAMSAKKFSTLGTEEASVKFTAYTGEGSPTIMILGETYGLEERVLLGYMEGGEEPVTTETFALPKELQNKNWVCVYALALFQRPGELFTFLGFEASAKGGDSSVQAKSIKDSFILGGKGNIQFLGFENADAVIARMDGAVVARPHLGSGDVKVAVEPGIYVVKAGGKSRKVVVK